MFKSRKSAVVAIAFVGVAGLLAGSFAIAGEKPTDAKGKGDMQLPPGVDPAHMQACMEAGMPGKNHAWLQKMVGTWKGTSQMWMSPEVTEPMKSECSEVITGLMDGRFIQTEMSGDMGGMPFTGRGVTGFDNVSKKFVGTWIDNCGTGIMTGTGDQSADGKTMKWEFTTNCPVTKKPTTMRITESYTGPDAYTMDFYMKDLKTGKEYKHMHMEMNRVK